MFLVLFCSQKFDSCVSDGRTDGHTSYKDVGTHLYSMLFYSVCRTAIAKSAKTLFFC